MTAEIIDLNKEPLHSSWQDSLKPELAQDYMQGLSNFLVEEQAAGKVIYPKAEQVFAALNATPLDQVKVVILGQDPYHGENQAHGLSFSVPKDVKIPPSLVNIYKEINSDLELPIPSHGNLRQWAEQGVLLLNSVLTVEHSLAASHQKQGWEKFTDKIISVINEQSENVVFMLWGAYAQKKGASINTDKHLVLKAPHPSPLSVYRGFYGCQHFSIANNYLLENNQTAIDWEIT